MITGANSASYTIDAGSYPSTDFYYYCKVTSGNKTLTKYFDVSVASTLQLTSETEQTTYCNANLGETVTLSAEGIVSTIENAVISYEWEKYNAETGAWELIKDQENATWTFMPEEDTEYFCKVSDGFSDFNLRFVVSINGFYLQCSESEFRDVLAGSSQTVSVTAYDVNNEVYTEPLSYTWKERVYDLNTDGYVYRTIENANSSSLTFTVNGKVTGLECIVTDGTLTKKSFIDVSAEIPENESIGDCGLDDYESFPDYGTSQTLSVYTSYEGDGTLSYQWYQKPDNGDSNADYVAIEGATESSLDVVTLDTENYICEINAPYETVYLRARIQCYSFECTDEDYNYWNEYGKPSTMTVKADSLIDGAVVSYQWYIYDTEKDEYVPIDGAVGSSYTADANTMTKPLVKFMCEVSDGCCRYTTYPELYVRGPALNPVPYDETGGSADIPYGGSVNLSVNPGEFPDAITSYEWYYIDYDHCDPETGEDLTGTLASGSDVKEITLTGDELPTNYADVYCKVTTENGFTSTAYWYISKEQSLKTSSLYTKKVRYGTETTLSVDASTYTNNEITYQWQVYSDEQEEYVDIDGETASSLVLSAEDTSVKHPDYRCKVSDGESTDTLNFYLTTYRFKLSTEKTSYDLDYGHSCTLQVESDTPVLPLTYTWKYGSEVLGSEASLTLTNDLNNDFTVPGTNTITCTAESEDGYSVKKTFKVWMEAPFYLLLDSPTVRYGEEVTLHAEFNTTNTAAAELSGDPSYQWYEYNEESYQYDLLEGETSADLKVTADDPNGKEFECKVSWNGVTESLCCDVSCYAFTYERYPDTVCLAYGQGYTFDTEAKAFDGDPLSFTWYKIIDEEEYETVEIEDAKDSSCSLSYEDLKDYNVVRCCIQSESGCTAKVNFYLSVSSAIKASACDYVDPAYGEPIDLKVKATTKADGAALNYKWKIYDEEKEEYTDLASTSDVCTLTSEQTRAESVSVLCTVSDTADSEPSRVWFDFNPVRLILSADQTKFTVPYGEEAELAVSCNEDVSYTWYYGSKVLGEGAKLTVNHELLPEYKAYSIYVKAETSDGWAERLSYKVDMQPSLTVDAPSYITLNYGEETDITLVPSSIADDPQYSVTWSYYDLEEEGQVENSDAGLTLHISAEDVERMSPERNYMYFYYTVSDGSSSYNGSVEVEVNYLQASTEYSPVVLEGKDTDLKANVIKQYKDGALTYEWVKWNSFLYEYEEVQTGDSNVLHLTADQLTKKEMKYACNIKDADGIVLDCLYYYVRSAKLVTDAPETIGIAENDPLTVSFNIKESLFTDYTCTWSYAEYESAYEELGETDTPSNTFASGTIEKGGYLRCRIASKADPSIYEDVLIDVYVGDSYYSKLDSIENHESDAAYDEAIKDDDNAAYVEEAEKNDFDVASAFKSFFAGFYDSIFGEASGNAEQLGRTEEEVQDENISLGAYVRKFFTNLREIMAENILGYVPGNSENETYKDDAEADTRANWNEYNGQDAASTDTTEADKTFLTGIFGTFKSNVNTDGSVTGQTEEYKSYFKAGSESGAIYRDDLKTFLTGKWAKLTNNCSHENLVTDKAVEATCTKTGLTEGSHCADCGKVVTPQEVVPKKAHTEVTDAAVAPTCTKTGLTAGSHCSVCETVITAQEEIPMTDHTAGTAVEKNRKEATCTETGSYDSVTYCTVCNKEISNETITIPATGHSWNNTFTVDKAATCTENGSTSIHCQKCDAQKDVTEIAATGHKAVSDAAVDATCAHAGKTAGSHCSVCGTVLTAQDEIPALAHTEVTDAAVAATCTKTGLTEGSHCSVCGTVITKQEVVKAKGHTAVVDKAVAATYTKTGKTAGSHCKVCGKVLVAQKTVAKLAKKTQTLKVSPTSITYKYAVIKKKKASFKISYTKAQGKVTFKSSNKNVTVTTKGVVTVKKGTKKGTYKITVTAAGNTVYKAGSKVVTIKVK